MTRRTTSRASRMSPACAVARAACSHVYLGKVERAQQVPSLAIVIALAALYGGRLVLEES